MNPAPVLALAVVLSAATAFAIVELTRPAPELSASSAGNGNDAGRQQADKDALAALLARVEKLEANSGRVSAPTPDRKQIEEAVADYLRKHGEASTSRTADASSPGTRRKDPKVLFEEAKQVIFDRQTTWDDRQAALRRLKESDQLDKMVALMEQRAQENPNDADTQMQLGQTYLAKTFGSDDSEKGDWATKADQAFDAALKANPEHWEARFSKAISLSFWPPFLGKSKVAIEQFEVLREQQERSGLKKDDYAQTYIFLANLYEQGGKADKALEVRKKGALLFPDHEDLKAALRESGNK